MKTKTKENDIWDDLYRQFENISNNVEPIVDYATKGNYTKYRNKSNKPKRGGKRE